MIVFVLLTLAYGMIAIHDIPYNVAKKRIIPTRMRFMRAAGLAFLRCAIWPFLWIWATSITRSMAMRENPKRLAAGAAGCRLDEGGGGSHRRTRSAHCRPREIKNQGGK